MDYTSEDFIIADEAELKIKLALETMPEKRRKVFEMSRVEGLSNDEIAKRLNLSKRTVESHLYTVIKELKELLALLALFIII